MFVSIIRTVVPMIVGAVVAFLVSNGIEMEQDAINGLTAFLTGLFSALYYIGVRFVEQRWPEFGVLLGSTKQPEYHETVK